MSLCADVSENNPTIYVTYYNSTTSQIKTFGVGILLAQVLSVTTLVSSVTVANLTSIAKNQVLTVYYEITNAYSYNSSIATNYINSITTTKAGSVGSVLAVVRSLGIGSKAFSVLGINYLLGSYQSSNQSGYYLIDLTNSLAAKPRIAAKLASGNGGGYLTLGLPSVFVQNNMEAFVCYLSKDFLQAVNKETNLSTGSQINGIYTQTGVSIVNFAFTTENLFAIETGRNLNITGGFLVNFDGVRLSENNFFLYPENLKVTTATSGGLITAQTYFYVAVYEWADNQGNLFRSAPSIPVSITTTGSTSTNTIFVPTLRLTYKVLNKVKITLYRWSTANQTYYQITSISSPILNSTTTDSVSFSDTLADSSIIGNSILYTTGGVLENNCPPASNLLTLFDNRLWLVSAEDPNTLYFSKEVLQTTPVEMSNLLTYYVAPSSGVQGSTGQITAIQPMDGALIVFKKNAIFYINGKGPDNTGLNSQYSQPILVNSTVGCENQKSIVITPLGLMFQSNKGIWLLTRTLETKYIGASVEDYNEFKVISANNIPATNQIRFGLDNGLVLVYDYYVDQWCVFEGMSHLSSTIFNGLYTYINSSAKVYQEVVENYQDGSSPVLMSFETGWINLAGLQGYQRAYFFYLLGQFLSPHKITVEIAYDYLEASQQVVIIKPDNYNQPWEVIRLGVLALLMVEIHKQCSFRLIFNNKSVRRLR